MAVKLQLFLCSSRHSWRSKAECIVRREIISCSTKSPWDHAIYVDIFREIGENCTFQVSRRRKQLQNKSLRGPTWVLSSSKTLMLWCSAAFHQTFESVCGAKLQTSLLGAATGSWNLGSTCPSCTSSPSASIWSYRWHKTQILNHWYTPPITWSGRMAMDMQ